MNHSTINVTQDNDGWPIEKQEWLESLFALQREHGNEKVRELLRALQNQALIEKAEFYRPADDSKEMEYLQQRRSDLGGYQPIRQVECASLPTPGPEAFSDALEGTERSISTTMSLVRMLTRLMKDGDIGKYVVPIVPDEARTFGMDGLFRIAQDELAKQGIAADVYSVTSYNLLYRDAIECEQWNRAHPEEETRIPFLSRVLEGCSGKFVAASDYMKVLPASVARWVPGDLVCLGTDGYGLSESRPVIRDHFGVSAEYIIRAAGGEA